MRAGAIFLILFFSNFLKGQIYVGNLQLGSQAEVTAFPVQFPGIKKIYGQLLIGVADTIQLSDITDLSPLSGLEYADYLYISNNGALPNLHGLEAMDTLYALALYHNPALTSLEGLHHLRKSDLITIRQNDALQHLEGLNRLQYASGLVIDRCRNLLDLDGLDSLERTFFGISIVGNPRLQSLNGMELLRESSVVVVQNDSLLHLGYFPALKNGGFELRENLRLRDFADMGVLTPDTLNLRLFDNPDLQSIEPVKNARWLGITVAGNDRLSTISIDSADYLIADISGPAIQHLQFTHTGIVSNFQVHDCQRLQRLEQVLPFCDSILFSYEIFRNDSLKSIREDLGPHYIRNVKVYENPQLETVDGFEALEAVSGRSPGNLCFDCGLYLRSPAFTSIRGFNKLKRGRLFFDGNHPDFEAITGFNAPNAIFDEVFNWSQPPKKVIGFQGVTKVIDHIHLAGIADTLSAFQNLEEMGTGFDWLELRVETRDSCFVDAASFAKLRNMEKVNLSNGSFSGYPLHFTALESMTDGSISTISNPNAFSINGLYPALTRIKSFGIQACPRLRSLDGIEGIQQFKQPAWPYSSFVAAYNCDSLFDCSAICYLEHHAGFSPANIARYYLDNPLYPCDDAASALFWCDTLSVSVGSEPHPDLNADIRIFPNPSIQQWLSLEMVNNQADGMYYHQVSDASGKVMLSGTIRFSGGRAVLNAGMLNAGFYRMRVWKEKEKAWNVSFIRQ